MPLYLSSRDTGSTEQMDNPECDRAELENTYRHFSTINSLISQWQRVYKRYLRPYARRSGSASVLDIGFGGGDIPLKLAAWAGRDGIDLHITAVDTDPRAVQYVQTLDYPDRITFRHGSTEDLVREDHTFDFVISNHLLHHLSGPELSDILEQTRRLSRRQVIFNDIRRSDVAYMLFGLFTRPIFQSSFITGDGLTSIRRSYTGRELQATVPEGWEVRKLFPFRLLLTYSHEEHARRDKSDG